MPYISKEEVARKRNKLKKEFPNFKFSVTCKNHSKICVIILEAPFNMLSDNDTYESVNQYYIQEHYKDEQTRKTLQKIKDIINEGNGVLVEDGDYGTVPNFYIDINIGSFDKPFKVVKKEKKIKKETNNNKESFDGEEIVIGEIKIVDYSEKSVAVIGDTKPIKDMLKEMGGKFNFRLKCGPGWIFKINQKSELINKIENLNKCCGDCGNTIIDDSEIFCTEIQSRVDSCDEICSSFSNGESQYR